MADEWTFDPPRDDWTEHKDGSRYPHRAQVLRRNGRPVGEIEIHCHKRHGPDGIPDLSWGVTAITYGPLAQRDKPDHWT